MAPKKFKTRQAADKAFKTHAAADPGGAMETYSEMSKSLKAQFKKTWVTTGTFAHVAQYKTRTIQRVEREGGVSIPKSEVWLIRELGDDGAKRHIAWARHFNIPFAILFVFMLLSLCCRACELQTLKLRCLGSAKNNSASVSFC